MRVTTVSTCRSAQYRDPILTSLMSGVVTLHTIHQWVRGGARRRRAAARTCICNKHSLSSTVNAAITDCTFSTKHLCQKLLKSNNACSSYSEKCRGSFLLRHSVYILGRLHSWPIYMPTLHPAPPQVNIASTGASKAELIGVCSVTQSSAQCTSCWYIGD